MSNKRNVVLYLDSDLVKKTKELGFNLSKTFENHLKQLINRFDSVYSQNNSGNLMIGSPGEIRTPVDGSKAHHACPLQSAKHFFSTGLNRVSRATFTFSYNFLVYINLSPMFIKYK